MRKIFAFLLVVLTIMGCGVLNRNKNLDVALKLDREKLKQSSILIFNFKEPDYAEGSGVFAAEVFHTRLLESKKFKVVSLDTSSPWGRLGGTEEERLLALLEEGRDRSFDYILVGEVKDFFYGGMNTSRVKMRVRIIEVPTNTTIFLADNSKEAESTDLHRPMDTRLSEKAEDPKRLAEKIIREFIKKI